MNDFIPASVYCNNVFDGTHETPKHVEIGRPFVTSKNIMGRKLKLSTSYNISESDYNSFQVRSKVSQWDVLFSLIGSVGEVYLEKEENIPYAIKNIGVFSCKDEYKAKWLYYYLQSPYAKSHINSYLRGAVQKFLSLGLLREFPIPAYDKSKNKIIDCLFNLDTKNELNQRINAELESMAKTLYDYWFVQFEFPTTPPPPSYRTPPPNTTVLLSYLGEDGRGYKSAGGKMVLNEKLGKEIPEGWDVKPLGKALKTHLGGTPSTKNPEYWENATIPWLNSGDLTEFPIIKSSSFVTKKGVDNSATTILPKGSVVISLVRYIRPSIIALEACANQSVVGIRESEELKNTFIYPYLVNEIPRLMSLRTGAQQPHINKETIDETLLCIPPTNILNEYYKISEPIYKKIINLAFKSQTLTELRDWLLPMLMNGQVQV